MITFQDMERDLQQGVRLEDFVQKAINTHLGSEEFKIAQDADLYDKQKNCTVMNYIRWMYSVAGDKVPDLTASNNKIASNFFHRLNTQRCEYSLGNGVSFVDHKKKTIDQETGAEITVDTTKEALGKKFDTDLKKAAYAALIHGISFGFYDVDRLNVYKITEFVPLWDEYTGALRAGIRFWKIDDNKPLVATLFEEDGFTKFKKEKNDVMRIEEEKQAYIQTIYKSEEGGIESIESKNYPGFPVVPLWGSPLHQSTLVGMKGKIDAFDLIRSGFANDLDDVAEVYWILNNAAGMDDSDMADFRRRLKLQHIAKADQDQTVTPYTQEIPYQARKVFLDDLHDGIYEDFGALDVHTIAAGATNDHIDAAYQPMDEEADDFEWQIIEFIQAILELQGIEDTPVFKRNRISNQSEQTTMVLSAADYLDEETVLQKLPFITPDEVSAILARKAADDASNFEDADPFADDDEGDEGGAPEEDGAPEGNPAEDEGQPEE